MDVYYEDLDKEQEKENDDKMDNRAHAQWVSEWVNKLSLTLVPAWIWT